MPTRITSLFPLLAIAASVYAVWQPQHLIGFGGWIVPILMFIMFCMGLTLCVADFRRILQFKSALLLGVVLQYSVMPLVAFLVAKLLSLPTELMVGMVLVGCASGGTASNVICFLAKADVALSISMTAVSTVVALFALPLLTEVYVGEAVPVPVLGLFQSMLKIVLIPVCFGVLIKHFFAATIERINVVLPVVATLAIVFVIAIIVALNHQRIVTVSVLLLFAVVLHNGVGLLLGYWGSRLFGHSKVVCRTIAIEVGMQNSGLAVALAVKYFSPVAALPGALFSIWHNITGSLLAMFWAQQQTENNHGDSA